MRTTLDIDDGVLVAAKETAQARRLSAGQVISDWARKGLAGERATTKKVRSGFPVFDVPADAMPLSPTTVNAIIDDEGAPARR